MSFRSFSVVLEYMLTVDPSQRPDIFQVSHVAFEMARKPNPVQNIEVRAA